MPTDKDEWCIVVYTNRDGTQNLLVRRLYQWEAAMAVVQANAQVALRGLTEDEAVDYAKRYEKLIKDK